MFQCQSCCSLVIQLQRDNSGVSREVRDTCREFSQPIRLVSHNTPHPLFFVSLSFQKILKSFVFDRLLQVLILRDLGTGSGEEQETKMAQSSWLKDVPPVAMKECRSD